MLWISRITAPVLLIAFAWPGLAADTSQWTNVQGLRAGDRIGIIQSDQKRIDGRFQSGTETGITLDADREITVPKENVVRVYRRARVSRPMRALIGGAIGLAGGAIVNATAGERFRNEGGDITAGALLGGSGIGAGIGAVTGGGYQTVYQRAANGAGSH